ncbi:MAG: methionyl-tRNA formyltransferase [Rhizobium sp.]|nr:methionyl-tRNA formyltransferase [Rhizobium sp.]
MRICLVGTVEGSAVAFDALCAAGHTPALVVTLPPEAAARHSDFVDLATPARAMGIAVHNTSNINATETLDAIGSSAPELTLVIGWSQICRKPFRDIARIGSVGFHPAALPRMRGRAVIPWTILRNEAITGSTLFWLDEGMDSGDILLQRLFPVEAEETARSLYDKHTGNIRVMVPEAVSLLRAGIAPKRVQDGTAASYCARRRPEDGLIDWTQPASDILRLIRAAGDPYPGAYTHHAGEKIRIDEACAFAHSRRFIGLPGQVQARTADSFVVMCGDEKCIEVRRSHTLLENAPSLHGKLG